MKKLLLFLLCGSLGFQAFAQLSNSQLMKIKDDADDGKTLWIKLLEDSYSQKNMSGLPALRKANEDFLNENISRLNRLYAEGDGRELLVAVKNYLTIEKQFVKDVMLPAESLKPEDEEGYNELNQKIADFTRKERSFELDVSNALRASPPEPTAADEPAEASEPEEAVSEEDVKQQEEAKPRRKEKLPHEMYEKGGKKKKNKKQQDEYEE